MNRISMLAIAPYEGMRLALMDAAQKRPEIALTVYVGDLEEGAYIARTIEPGKYDVILSRGGTAEMIRDATHLPVVEIALSVYDILRAIRLVQNFTERHAIVGFPSITTVARLLQDLIKSDIEIVTIHSPEQAASVLHELKEKSYRMVIGDMVTSRLAKEAGMNSVLLTSGTESIDNAFDQAMEQFRLAAELKQHNEQLKQVIANTPILMAAFDSQNTLLIDNLKGAREYLLPILKRELATRPDMADYSFIKKNKDMGQQFIIETKRTAYESTGLCTTFFISSQGLDEQSGIDYLSKTDAQDEHLKSFYTIGLKSDLIHKQVERYHCVDLPLVVTGERGTGRDSLAVMLYLQSDCVNHPMMIVDCETAKEKGWRYLLENHQSPLSSTGHMVVFKNCQCLSAVLSQQLFDFVEETNAARRNKLLFAFTLSPEGEMDNRLYHCLMEHATSLKIMLPPLRDSMSEVHNLISLCISSLNVTLGKQIIGMEESAVKLIQAFSWTENYAQLKRVIMQVMLLCNKNIIDEQELRSVLAQEALLTEEAHVPSTLLAPGATLDTITKSIVKLILAQEEGNQTKAAQRLGISRSTLWRMLK